MELTNLKLLIFLASFGVIAATEGLYNNLNLRRSQNTFYPLFRSLTGYNDQPFFFPSSKPEFLYANKFRSLIKDSEGRKLDDGPATLTEPEFVNGFTNAEQYRQVQDALMKTTQVHSRQLAEDYLMKFDVDCLQFLYCNIAANKENLEYPEAVETVRMFRAMTIAFSDRDDGEDELVEADTIHKLVAAFDLGERLDDSGTLCRSVFPCGLEQVSKGRSTCSQADRLCPAIVISCSLCGIFSPGTCGTVCNMAALYCGISGYSCMIAQAKDTSAPSARSEVLDEADEMERQQMEVTGLTHMEKSLEESEGEIKVDVVKPKRDLHENQLRRENNIPLVRKKRDTEDVVPKEVNAQPESSVLETAEARELEIDVGNLESDAKSQTMEIEEVAAEAETNVESRILEDEAVVPEPEANVESRSLEDEAVVPEPEANVESRSLEDEAVVPEPEANVESRSLEDESVVPEPETNVGSRSLEDETVVPETETNVESKSLEDEAVVPESETNVESKSLEDEAIVPEPEMN